MESIKELITYNVNRINSLCTNLYSLVMGFRSPYVVNLTSSNIDLSAVNILNDTIILQGTLTANVIVTLSSTIRKYRIINNCGGSYYVTIKTSSNPSLYSAVGDVWDVYCDGVDIKIIGLVSSTRYISGSRTATQTLTMAVGATVVWTTVTGDAVGEMSNGVFTAKNQGVYAITGFVVLTGTVTAYHGSININDVTVTQSLSDRSVGGRESTTATVLLNAGDTIKIIAYAEGTSCVIGTQSQVRITQIR